MSTAPLPEDNLMFGEHEIHAHRVVLSQQSEWFLAEFTGGPPDTSVLELSDGLDPLVLGDVFRYMYQFGKVHGCMLKPEVPYSLEWLYALYDIADTYNIGALKHKVDLCFWHSAVCELDRLTEDPASQTDLIRYIYTICGANSVLFVDDTLQKTVVYLCAKYYNTLLKIENLGKAYSQKLLFNAKCDAMFKEKYAEISLAGDGWGREGTPGLTIKDFSAKQRNTTDLFECLEFSDIMLPTGKDRQWAAHKVVLAGHSTSILAYFEKAKPVAGKKLDRDNDDPILLRALIHHMYMPGPSDIPLPSHADLCLMAIRFGCHAASLELQAQFMDLVVREPFDDRYISAVTKVCGPKAGKDENTPLAEQVFQDVLERIRAGASYPESFGRGVEGRTVFNPAFTARLAGVMLAVHAARMQHDDE